MLTSQGRTVDLYETERPKTACGIHSCAWGVGPGFSPRIERAGLDHDRYIINRVNRVFFRGRNVPAEIFLIDKPALIRDLIEGSEVLRTPIPAHSYDRILDCTGVARAYLPPAIGTDKVCTTVQYRMKIADAPDDQLHIRYGVFKGSWIFPLGNRTCHVGGGCLPDSGDNARAMLQRSGLLDADGQVNGHPGERLCGCTSALRLTGPVESQPHTVPTSEYGCPIWGVGESIGTVSPFTGEGITNALACAALYLCHESDPWAYTAAVLDTFSWITRERKILDARAAGRWFTPFPLKALRQNGRRMGIRFGFWDALAILHEVARY